MVRKKRERKIKLSKDIDLLWTQVEYTKVIYLRLLYGLGVALVFIALGFASLYLGLNDTNSLDSICGTILIIILWIGSIAIIEAGLKEKKKKADSFFDHIKKLEKERDDG